MPSSSADPGSGPRTIGKYELIRRIARGGMGDVHLARLPGELGFEKRLVIKTIRPDLAADPRFVELFAAEAKLAVALSHPNITPIYELGRAADGTLFTAMGWVDGPSLARLLTRLRERGRTLELGAALFITRELLDGLAHAHRRDRDRPPVVHRDITPRNVLVDRSGRVQIIDFGIAKPAEAEVAGQMGSIGYMAPEQARAELVDPRADVFGVGCVIYELLTHRRAFETEGVWMRPSMAALPERTRALIERALALDPRERFADAEAFLRALTPVLTELAPNYASFDLAALITESFPEDDHDLEPIDAREPDDRTPATAMTGALTFATRVGPTEAVAQPEGVVAEPVRERGPGWALALVAIVSVLLIGVSVHGSLPAVSSDPTPEPPGPVVDPSPGIGPSPVVDPSPGIGPIPAPREQPSAATRPLPLATEPAITTTLTVEVIPSDAAVEFDGERLAGPPYTVQLDGEAIELRVTHPDRRAHQQTLDPDSPPASPLVIELVPLDDGALTVLAPAVAWAEVWLDGANLGTTPLTAKPVVEGKHRLEVRCVAAVCGTARVLLEQSVRIKPGRTLVIRF